MIQFVDAPSYGVAAVLSHQMRNGEERPIVVESKTLISAKRNNLEKQVLAIIVGVKQFHQYFGRLFTIQTNDKPLLGSVENGKEYQ